MKKVLKYRNLNVALFDSFMFERNFVAIRVSRNVDPDKLLEVYKKMKFGIIVSPVKVKGVITNIPFVKRAQRYELELSRTETGLIVLPPKQYDERQLEIVNGKKIKNVIFAMNDERPQVFYKKEQILLPEESTVNECLHAYCGHIHDTSGMLVENVNLPDNIVDVVQLEKNIILKSEEDFELFELYKNGLTNYKVNSEDHHQVNIYLTEETFNECGEVSGISIFPEEIISKLRYVQNHLKLEKLLGTEKYYFEIKPKKDVYVIAGEKTYVDATNLASNTNVAIVDSILIFENIKTARSFRDYFQKNEIYLNNNRKIKTNVGKLNLKEESKHIYSCLDNNSYYNQYVLELEKTVDKVIIEGEEFYHMNEMKLNNYHDVPVKYEPGNGGGGYVFSEKPTFNAVFSDEVFDVVSVDNYIDTNRYCDNYTFSFFEDRIYKTSVQNIVYIYDIAREGDKIRVEVFHHGYRDREFPNILVTEATYTEVESQVSTFYNKYAADFKENFTTYLFDAEDDILFHFENDEKLCKVRPIKHLRNKMIRNDVFLRIHRGKIRLKSTEQYRKNQFEELIETQSTNSYIFMDRGTQAGDNAEHIYRYYLHNDKTRTHYYILDSESPDWDRLSAEGFNLIQYQSYAHKELFLCCEKIITSHVADRIFNPFSPSFKYNYLIKAKVVFLQHGITIANHRGFLDKYSRPLELFISGAIEEAEQVKQFSEYPNVQCTGFARFDYLRREKQGYILYAPSWNTIYRDNFGGSKYQLEVQKVLEDPKVLQVLKANGLKLKLLLHPEFMKYSTYFTTNEYVEIVKPEEVNYNKFISEADMLITDYSSLYFDFLYQEKQVILHQPYELHNTTSILTKPENCVRKSYNIDELVSHLQDIEQLSFESDKKEEILDFFGHVDSNNCSRIYTEIEKL